MESKTGKKAAVERAAASTRVSRAALEERADEDEEEEDDEEEDEEEDDAEDEEEDEAGGAGEKGERKKEQEKQDAGDEILVVEGSEEVFTHEIPDPVKTTKMRISLRKKAAPSTSVRSQPSGKTEAQAKPRKRTEIPGGIFPMLGFLIVFNAIALGTLLLLFPELPNGSRGTPWGAVIPRSRIPWPALLALIVGHVVGFLAWAGYVRRLHSQEKEQAESEAVDTEKTAESVRTKSKARGG